MVFILFIMAILVVKFLLIIQNNVLEDLQDESAVESTVLAQTQ